MIASSRLQKLQHVISSERLAGWLQWRRIPLMDRWLVKELLITKLGWPVAQPRFSKRPSAKMITE